MRNVIQPAVRILGKISSSIKKGIDIATGIPSLIDTIRGRKDDIKNKLNNMVNQLPDSKIKDKLTSAVNKSNEVANKVIDTGQNISNKVQPWVKAANNILYNSGD